MTTHNALDEAITALGEITSNGDELKADLMELVKNTSVSINTAEYTVNANATTVLFSGKINGDSSYSIVARCLVPH